jgi:hypothetical protein
MQHNRGIEHTDQAGTNNDFVGDTQRTVPTYTLAIDAGACQRSKVFDKDSMIQPGKTSMLPGKTPGPHNQIAIGSTPNYERKSKLALLYLTIFKTELSNHERLLLYPL